VPHRCLAWEGVGLIDRQPTPAVKSQSALSSDVAAFSMLRSSYREVQFPQFPSAESLSECLHQNRLQNIVLAVGDQSAAAVACRLAAVRFRARAVPRTGSCGPLPGEPVSTAKIKKIIPSYISTLY